MGHPMKAMKMSDNFQYKICTGFSSDPLVFSSASIKALLIEVFSKRYEWLRENPSFMSLVVCMDLTPEVFDALVDKHRAQGTNNV